eukprot:145441-Pleurochrysis_carterae.AAC.2
MAATTSLFWKVEGTDAPTLHAIRWSALRSTAHTLELRGVRRLNRVWTLLADKTCPGRACYEIVFARTKSATSPCRSQALRSRRLRHMMCARKFVLLRRGESYPYKSSFISGSEVRFSVNIA